MTRPNMIISLILLAGIIGLFLIKPATLGQVINSAYSCQNGVCTWAYRIGMRGSTSTPCSIRSPESTSTIQHVSWVLETQATSSLLMDIGWGSNMNATTTSLASTTLAANTKGTLVATSTLNGLYVSSTTTSPLFATNTIPILQNITNHIISPNQYVNFRFGREAGISIAPTGSCEVIFRVL